METSRPKHRYLTRIETLLRRLDGALAAGERAVEMTLLGVNHSGHVLPDAFPCLSHADFVSLELPTTPVRAYLEPGGAPGKAGSRGEIHLRNIFWLDLLEYYRRQPPPLGVYGCNVNPHVRYLRARLYYRHGLLTNDFGAPAVVVLLPSERTWTLEELGGSGAEALPAAAVPEALPDEVRQVFRQNGIVHVGPRENPFGPGRHLVVLEEPPSSLLALQSHASALLEPLAQSYGLDQEELCSFVQGQLLEAFLLPVNDFYLVENFLGKLIRAISAAGASETIRVVHVAGLAHLAYLERYLSALVSERLRVRAEGDPRFPIPFSVLVPDFFARELEQTLSVVSLRGEELDLDLPGAGALVARYVREEEADVRRRLLLRAIWSREGEDEAEEFATLADEPPLAPSRSYLDQYAFRLNWLVVEYLLGEQPLPVLETINDRLREAGRRGQLATVGQEVRDAGLSYARMAEHPVVGPYVRALEELWQDPEVSPAEVLRRIWGR